MDGDNLRPKGPPSSMRLAQLSRGFPGPFKKAFRFMWERRLERSIIGNSELCRLAARNDWLSYSSPAEEWNPSHDLSKSGGRAFGNRLRPVRLPSGFCICVEGASLIGPRAGAFLGARPILAGVGGSSDVFLARRGEILGREEYAVMQRSFFPVMPRRREIVGRELISLVPIYRNYFYHWLLEYLPRLQWINSIVRSSGLPPRVLIPYDPPPFVIDSLHLLGIPPEDLVYWPGGICRVEKMWVPHHYPHAREADYAVSKRDIDWVKNALGQAAANHLSSDRDRSERPRRIYVSRQRARTGDPEAGLRRISNLYEVAGDLVERGFEILDLSSMSLSDQIRTVSNAEIIAGPHGAGLTHMIFTRRAHVVEIFPESSPLPFFPILAAASGCPYIGVPAVMQERGLVVSRDRLLWALDQTIAAVEGRPF